MKYFIISAGLFISAAILQSARYIASAVLCIITNSFGDSILSSNTQSLSVLSLVATISALLFLFIGLIKKN